MTTAASLPWFQFERETIRKIDIVEKVERNPRLKTALLRWVFPFSLGVAFRWLTSSVVNVVVSKLDAKAERFASSAIWFEGAQRGLMQRIVETGSLPSKDLLRHIAAFERSNTAVIELSRENVKALRELHRASRLASAFERLEQAAVRLGASVDGIKVVVVQAELGQTYLVDAKRERDSFLKATSMISSPTFDDVAPDLLSLAEQAVAAVESRNSANDEDWPQRLARAPL